MEKHCKKFFLHSVLREKNNRAMMLHDQPLCSLPSWHLCRAYRFWSGCGGSSWTVACDLSNFCRLQRSRRVIARLNCPVQFSHKSELGMGQKGKLPINPSAHQKPELLTASCGTCSSGSNNENLAESKRVAVKRRLKA